MQFPDQTQAHRDLWQALQAALHRSHVVHHLAGIVARAIFLKGCPRLEHGQLLRGRNRALDSTGQDRFAAQKGRAQQVRVLEWARNTT